MINLSSSAFAVDDLHLRVLVVVAVLLLAPTNFLRAAYGIVPTAGFGSNIGTVGKMALQVGVHGLLELGACVDHDGLLWRRGHHHGLLHHHRLHLRLSHHWLPHHGLLLHHLSLHHGLLSLHHLGHRRLHHRLHGLLLLHIHHFSLLDWHSWGGCHHVVILLIHLLFFQFE